MEELEFLDKFAGQVFGMYPLEDVLLPDGIDSMVFLRGNHTEGLGKTSVKEVALVGMHVAQHGQYVFYVGIMVGYLFILLQLHCPCFSFRKILPEEFLVQLVYYIHTQKWSLIIIACPSAKNYFCKDIK